MEYGRIISVTGLGGLYELVGSKTDGALVRSLEDGTTKFVSSRLHNFSHLESIEVYTEGENINLVDVFRTMKESGETLPAENDTAATTEYFKKVVPTMDFKKVYNSDRKKMIRWSAILEKAGVELKTNAERQQEMMDEYNRQQEAGETGDAKENETPADGDSSEQKLPETERPAEASTSGVADVDTPADTAAKAPKPPKKVKTETGENDEEAPKKKATRKKKADDSAE